MPGTIASGKIVRLYVDDVAIGNSTECKLDFAQEVVSISHKDIDPGVDSPGFEQGSPGKKSVTASNSSFYAEDDSSYETLVEALAAGSTITVKMTGNVSGSLVTTFDAIVTAVSLTAPVDNKVTFTCSFKGITTPVMTRVA